MRYATKEKVLRQHPIELDQAVSDEVNTSMRSQEVALLTEYVKKDCRNVYVFFSRDDYQQYNVQFRLQMTSDEREMIKAILILVVIRENKIGLNLPQELCEMVIAAMLNAGKVTLAITGDLSKRPKITTERHWTGWAFKPKDPVDEKSSEASEDKNGFERSSRPARERRVRHG